MTQVLEAPADEVALAEQAVADAEEAEAELFERVRAGDDEVTPDELQAARTFATFTRLRLDAARRKAAAGEQAAEQARKDEARAAIAALLAGDQPTNPDTLAPVLDAAESALEALVAAVDERNELIQRARGRAMAAGLNPDTDGAGPSGADGLIVDAQRRGLSPVKPSQVLAGLLLHVLGGQVHGGARPWSDLGRHANALPWRSLIGRDLA